MEFIHNENQIALYNEEEKLIAEVTFPYIDTSTVNVDRTFVDDSLRGQGIASQLMQELAEQLRSQNKKAVLSCSYAISWFARHEEEYGELLR